MRKTREPRKLILVGLDGFSPPWLQRLLDDGRLPALASLCRRGADVDLISTLPAITPSAWASIATGAWPATHGIDGFLVHRPGDPFDRRVSGCYSTRCTAEPVWETATRHGLRSCVVKFPLSYPATSATFRLDGAAGWGGLHCLHELVPSGVTDSAEERAGRSLRAAEPWPESLPESPAAAAAASPAESPAASLAAAPPGEPVAYWRWRLPSLWGGAPVELDVALVRDRERAKVVVASAPSWDKVLATAGVDEWSEPIAIAAADRRGRVTGWRFRIRPLECAADAAAGPRLRLLNTTVHELLGHSAPATIWERHVAGIGPIEEQTEPSMLFNDGIDVPTLLELWRLNAGWLTNACQTLLTSEDWDLFMVHAHFIDWAHHAFEGGIDPRHPDFDPDRRGFFEDAVAGAYALADGLVAAVREIAGDAADVMVVGDHGQDLVHTTLHVNELLAEAGLLAWQGAGEEVDWFKTAAYAMGNYVYVNTIGRDPEGVVLPNSVDEVRTKIIETLLNLTDPGRGSRPVLIAGPKEQFEALGAHGAGAGDVVFCLRSGYQARNGRGPLLAPTRLLREYTGSHDHFWPYDRRLHTRLLAAGPSFRSGYHHPRAERVIDVAPTIAQALGIPPPKHCEGHPITAMLRDVPAGAGSPAREGTSAGAGTSAEAGTPAGTPHGASGTAEGMIA